MDMDLEVAVESLTSKDWPGEEEADCWEEAEVNVRNRSGDE